MQRATMQPALTGRYKYIALVEESPIMSTIYNALVKQYPNRILLGQPNQLVNGKGYHHRDMTNVLFAVNHNILTFTYKNKWLEFIAKRNRLTNQAVGIISIPAHISLNTQQTSEFQTFMINDQLSLINGYYPVRYDMENADTNDVKIVISAISSAVLRE